MSPYTGKTSKQSPESKSPISWVQLAAEMKSVFICSCDMVLKNVLHPAFSSCEVVLNPTDPYARRLTDTQRAERERQRRLHASFSGPMAL